MPSNSAGRHPFQAQMEGNHMAQTWTFWKADLAAPGTLSRDVTDPGQGFWRHKGAKTKIDWPIAIWFEGDVPKIKVGNKLTEGEDALLEFLSGSTWLNAVAVSHADYLAAMETGKWSDGKPARKMDEAERHDIDISEGDNAAPVEESLADQIAALAAKINATAEPTTQDQANTLAGNLDKMRALLKLAENKRVEEKQPHLDAGREVDSKWQAIGEPGGNAYRDGEAKRKAFLKKEQARLDAIAAEDRRKEQERIDAENKRIREENERIAAEAAEKGEDAAATLVPEISAPAAEAPRATAGGTFGRSTGLRKVTVIDAVDVAVLAKHFIDGKDADFITYLTDRAKKAVRAKITLPGVTTKEELQ